MIIQRRQTYVSRVDFDSFVVFMCLFRSIKHSKGNLRSSLETGLSRPEHVNITPVITSVDFGQFSLYYTGRSLFFNDYM